MFEGAELNSYDGSRLRVGVGVEWIHDADGGLLVGRVLVPRLSSKVQRASAGAHAEDNRIGAGVKGDGRWAEGIVIPAPALSHAGTHWISHVCEHNIIGRTCARIG